MSEETIYYTTDMNFQNPKIVSGSVFTREDWTEKGGSEVGLDNLIKKKYVQTVSAKEDPAPTITVDSAETKILEQPEDSSEEESKDEVISEEIKAKPQGIWCFKVDDLEALEIDALNALARDHAAKYGIDFQEEVDKDTLILKMCSEA